MAEVKLTSLKDWKKINILSRRDNMNTLRSVESVSEPQVSIAILYQSKSGKALALKEVEILLELKFLENPMR